LTILGVSSSRWSGNTALIGQFGTGAKFSIALLLRQDLLPTICIGNLRMSFGTRPKMIDGSLHQQVQIRYGGQDFDGRSVSRTETLSYTTGLGEIDWTDLTMAAREFVSNAIDGALRGGSDLGNVEVEITDSVRAKAGWTQVFIPASPEVVRFYTELPIRFLHFHPTHKNRLEEKMLDKIAPQDRQVRIYKKGVLVATVEHEGGGAFDYNLGDELKLDESRNAKEWDVKVACGRAWATASKEQKEALILALSQRPELWESTLDSTYMDGTYYLAAPQQDACRNQWKQAFEQVHGDDSVIVTSSYSANYAARKGFTPISTSLQLKQIARNSGVRNEDSVLTGIERSGRVILDPTPAMEQSVDDWWKMIVTANMQNGRQRPDVKAFQEAMDAGCQTFGLAENGTVYLHLELAEAGLRKVAIEELAHHCTGAGDNSRDFQDWILRLLTQIVIRNVCA